MRTRVIGCVCAIGVGAAFLTPLAASGELVIRPVLFAVEYCSLRRAGVSEAAAIREAVRRAARKGENPGTVRAWGREVDVDNYLAVEAVTEACPEYLIR